MFEEKVWDLLKTRCAIISANDESGPFTTRLYVDKGNTATQTVKKAKTLAGAQRQAAAMFRFYPTTRKQALVDVRKQEAIEDIQSKLETIAAWTKKQAANPSSDWSDVGDLNHVLNELQEIAKFIG